jgi:hypothetical protein
MIDTKKRKDPSPKRCQTLMGNITRVYPVTGQICISHSLCVRHHSRCRQHGSLKTATEKHFSVKELIFGNIEEI